MVRSSRRASILLPGWIPGELTFDEPDREHAVRALLVAYKAMAAESTDRFVDAIAEATGSGRPGSDHVGNLWMTWDMVREMKKSGMVIAGHSVNHVVLARSSRERQQEEITGCAARLSAELGEPMRHFSYPVGDHARRSMRSPRRAFARPVSVSRSATTVASAGSPTGTTTTSGASPSRRTRLADWIRSIAALPQIFS